MNEKGRKALEEDKNEQLKPDADNSSGKEDQAAAYWKANVTLIGILLSIWFLCSIVGGILFVNQLNHFTIGKLPFGFWLSNQGSIIIFVILIMIYAFGMDRIEKKYHVDKD